MVFNILVSALTIILLCIIIYAFFSQNRDLKKKPVTRSVARSESQTVSRSTSDDPPPSDDISQPVENIPPASPGAVDESAQTAQTWLSDGMALVFSAEAPSQEKTMTPLRADGVRDDVRRRVLSHITSLKNFDTVYQMQRMLGDPKTTMANLSLMITSDPLLSAKVLQVANSPYYGMEQKLNSISHAIMIIGMVNLKAIIYHEGVLQFLKERSFRNNPTMQAIWQHANYTSIYASYLHYLFDGLNMGNLFTLGLLHDIGKFIMMKLTPLPERGVEAIRKYSPNWTMSEEEETYGINHALVGRMALRQWGLSPLIIETVSLHHAPICCAPAELGLDREILQYLLVVFLADQAARLFAGRTDADARVDLLHPAYHGLIDQNKLSRLIVDKSLMGQLREAEAITGVYA